MNGFSEVGMAEDDVFSFVTASNVLAFKVSGGVLFG